MVGCCVPFCSSNQRKTTNVSFHQFPCDVSLQTLWLQRISRKDFVVNDKSASSLVCSLHFTDDDYREGQTKRLLKKGVIPSIFPGYPLYKQPKPVNHRSTKRSASVNFSKKSKKIKYNESDNQRLEQANLLLFFANGSQDARAATKVQEVSAEFHDLNSETALTAFTKSDMATQTADNLINKLEEAKKKIKLLQSKIYKQQAFIRKQQFQIKEMKKNKTSPLTKIYENVEKFIALSEHGDIRALFILQQLQNAFCGRPKWHEDVVRECILWSSCSPKGYSIVRERKLFRLPCRMTLNRYLGPFSGETGLTNLIKNRLQDECQKLNESEKFTSIVIDEMAIKPQCIFDKKLDSFFGKKSSIGSNSSSNPDDLANRLLCFVLCGLSSAYRIPCAYYFTKQLTGKDLHSLTVNIIREIENLGFVVVRVVTDNHKTNVAMFKLLGQGKLNEVVAHPSNNTRNLFLSFDQNHIIKNIRSLHLEKEMRDDNGLISGTYVKRLYQLQSKENIKPVRNLTRRHVEPTNLDKMNVRRAVLIFSPPVTAALECLQQHSRIHPAAYEFKDASSTIIFLKNIYRWFSVHDVCSKESFYRSKNEDRMPFFSCSDERLEWLKREFLPYLENVKIKSFAASPPLPFLSKETHEAIKFTTRSTVECIQYLLKSGFQYVLTRKFNSDPVELMFSALRQMNGANDMLDVRATLFSLEKILKTGRMISSKHSNVSNDTNIIRSSHCRGQNSTVQTESITAVIPAEVLDILKSLYAEELGTERATMKLASLAFIAGFVVRAIAENINCQSCIESVSQSGSSSPLLCLIKNQDRGGLRYPQASFVSVLATLEKFVTKAFLYLPQRYPLEMIKGCILPYFLKCPSFSCTAVSHVQTLAGFILDRFLPILLKNHAQNLTDQIRNRIFYKPLNRKMLKLS